MRVRRTGSRIWLHARRLANQIALYSSYRLKRPHVLGLPDNLLVEPTNACNARCPLCPTGAGQLSRPVRTMNLTLFKALIDQTYQHVASINLWNLGEPTLNPHIFDMIRYAQDHDIRVKVSTNGFVLYDPENVARLLNSHLDYLIVSLDGATAETFVKYRVGVDFDRVLKGLRLLCDEKRGRGLQHPTIEWQFIVMRHNEHEVEQARTLAGELGVIFSLKTAWISEATPDMFETYLPTQADLARYERRPNGEFALKAARTNDCGFIWHSLVVNADGGVVPCCYDYDLKLALGNIKDQTIKEIWQGSKIRSLRLRILTNRSGSRPCATCEVDAWTPRPFSTQRLLRRLVRGARH